MNARPATLITVRTVNILHDAERIALVCGQLGYTASPSEVRERLINAGQHGERTATFVADLPESPVVGWIQIMARQTLITPPSVEIEGIVVDEKHRGKGIGKRLIEAAESWAKQERCEMIKLRSNIIRENAHRFYESLGYAITKKQLTFMKSLPPDPNAR